MKFQTEFSHKSLNLNFCLQVIKLISLIDAGDVDGVSKLLSQKVGLNPPKGVTLEIKYIPLFCAVEKGDCVIMELLLKAGADPNIKGIRTIGEQTEHLPPLGLAARHKSYGVFKKLLQYGANSNVIIDIYINHEHEFKSVADIVPLEYLNLHKILLENGADPDCRDFAGHTLMSRGCTAYLIQLVQLLLTFNADLEIPCNAHRSNTVDYMVFSSRRYTQYTNVAPFEYMRSLCLDWVERPVILPVRYYALGAIQCIRIAWTLAMAGAVVHKDMLTGKSVTAMYEDWTHIENTVQSAPRFTEEEKQEASDCLKLIKGKLKHPSTLADLCRYRIRRILRPDFHRKLKSLKLPRSIEDFIAMKDIFPPLYEIDNFEDYTMKSVPPLSSSSSSSSLIWE